MTIEERFERIEHVTAGLAEERRKDREENRQLWRDTQRQLNELTIRVSDLTIKIADVNENLGARIENLGTRIERFAEESRAADARLEERIGALVSAIGQWIAK